MYRHILLPTDGSKHSLRAARMGIELARAQGARVTAFWANPGIDVAFYTADVPMPQEVFDAETARLRKLGARYLDAIRKLAAKAGVPVHCMEVEDRMAAEAIMAAARRRRCDLIVMSSHGRSGIRAVLLGSVTQKVLTHSRVPVLVCRA